MFFVGKSHVLEMFPSSDMFNLSQYMTHLCHSKKLPTKILEDSFDSFVYKITLANYKLENLSKILNSKLKIMENMMHEKTMHCNASLSTNYPLKKMLNWNYQFIIEIKTRQILKWKQNKQIDDKFWKMMNTDVLNLWEFECLKNKIPMALSRKFNVGLWVLLIVCHHFILASL